MRDTECLHRSCHFFGVIRHVVFTADPVEKPLVAPTGAKTVLRNVRRRGQKPGQGRPIDHAYVVAFAPQLEARRRRNLFGIPGGPHEHQRDSEHGGLMPLMEHPIRRFVSPRQAIEEFAVVRDPVGMGLWRVYLERKMGTVPGGLRRYRDPGPIVCPPQEHQDASEVPLLRSTLDSGSSEQREVCNPDTCDIARERSHTCDSRTVSRSLTSGSSG